jgi:hypothetical protein
MTQALWTQKGESLSHKNASKEYGLEESEIIEAIRAGKLQYKISKYPPAKPGALRLLAPQRGLFAIVKNKNRGSPNHRGFTTRD